VCWHERRVTRGRVNAAPGFVERGMLIGGCSGLLVSAFGVRGRDAVGSVGLGSLPSQSGVEVDAAIRVEAAPG
jgi:hypothetical protein